MENLVRKEDFKKAGEKIKQIGGLILWFDFDCVSLGFTLECEQDKLIQYCTTYNYIVITKTLYKWFVVLKVNCQTHAFR